MGGLNLYEFCGNDGLNGFDPTGLCRKKSFWQHTKDFGHSLWHSLDWIPDLIFVVPAEVGSVIDQENDLADKGYDGWNDYNMQNDPNYVPTAGDTDWVQPMADLERDAVTAYVTSATAIAGCATAPEMDMAIGMESASTDGVGLGTSAEATESSSTVNMLADDALVVRGGSNTAERFANASGATTDENGILQGVSVQSANGVDVTTLSQNIPHSQVGVTTAGQVRAAGGNVVPSGTASNPYHATMGGIDANTASDLFTPTIPNPARRQ